MEADDGIAFGGTRGNLRVAGVVVGPELGDRLPAMNAPVGAPGCAARLCGVLGDVGRNRTFRTQMTATRPPSLRPPRRSRSAARGRPAPACRGGNAACRRAPG